MCRDEALGVSVDPRVLGAHSFLWVLAVMPLSLRSFEHLSGGPLYSVESWGVFTSGWLEGGTRLGSEHEAELSFL